MVWFVSGGIIYIKLEYVNVLRENPHMFYTPSFTLLYSRKGKMSGTKMKVYFLVLTRM